MSRFTFVLGAQDQEDLRWYLEDYLQYPLDPAPRIAQGIERRMAVIGNELFRGIFQTNDDSRRVWSAAYPRLSDTRVEITSGGSEGTALPWELLRDPKTGLLLALRTPSFVRSAGTRREQEAPRSESGPIRVLLAICRPRGRNDVPFRSVAKRLLKGLGEAEREIIHLEVLRPPTFEALARRLREAKGDGEPFHILHFDGHGAYADRGYLMFENPVLDENQDPVDGHRLGELLAETEVAALVLNACRSAHAAPPSQPDSVNASTTQDEIGEARTFGSLAQEVSEACAASTGVVAMRYNIFVDTAAQFMADLYGTLAQGHSLGEAVALGRKQLETQRLRGIAFDPVPLQDWIVPVVYESAPIVLFPKPLQASPLKIKLGGTKKEESSSAKGQSEAGLPARPDAGFFGRDETLLALDRAFDSQSVVLLHAYAGSGKTSTAVEFARWYKTTGGVTGPVLFTSFTQHKPLARVLDDFGSVFQKDLERAGVQWGAIDDVSERRNVALQVLAQIPVLWIWDNVEPIAGFPSGTQSAWTIDEQRELADFLRAARDAATEQARPKFLLTSRRDEHGWLGDLPARVQIPPMPFLERVELARALAEKHQRRLTEIEDWRPLLDFTQGNPMTITILVGQALRDKLHTSEQIEGFVNRLRAGEAAFEDEESEGRSRSLGASLTYGFQNAFSEAERKQLAVLHLFQGFVDVDMLRAMGDPQNPAHLSELRGLDRQAGILLLDRAAEIGILTRHGEGYYSIHPAVPWFLKKLFEQYCPGSTIRVEKAFTEAVGTLGDFCASEYVFGSQSVIILLRREEANLLYARRIARTRGWSDTVTSVMQGLKTLYGHMGRQSEWAHLVEEIVPDYINPDDDGPIPGQEEQWSLVTGYRVRLAQEARRWTDALRLQVARVNWDRQGASDMLAVAPEALDDRQRNVIRNLGSCLSELAEIQRQLGREECLTSYTEAYELARRIDDDTHASIAAFNLGNAYFTVPNLRNLSEAERWYKRDLEHQRKNDHMGRARTLGQLAGVEYEKHKEARLAAKPTKEATHLRSALRLSLESLNLLPPDAIPDLAIAHDHLGVIYREMGEIDAGLEHHQKSIRCWELMGDVYGASNTRNNLALALASAGRLSDAKEYAMAALRGFQTLGPGAEDNVRVALDVIAFIDKVSNRSEAKRANAPEDSGAKA